MEFSSVQFSSIQLINVLRIINRMHGKNSINTDTCSEYKWPPVLWNLSPCMKVNNCKGYGGTYGLHIQGRSAIVKVNIFCMLCYIWWY
jgi:hypothetical protein